MMEVFSSGTSSRLTGKRASSPPLVRPVSRPSFAPRQVKGHCGPGCTYVDPTQPTRTALHVLDTRKPLIYIRFTHVPIELIEGRGTF